MQKAWQAWTFVDFGPNRSVQDGRPEGGEGVAATGCACVGFGAVRASVFMPAEAAGGYETVAGAYFCTTLKS